MKLYPNIIYHADSGTLIFIDTLQGIGNPRNADIVEYTSAVDGKAKSFTKDHGQRSLTLNGKISTENENTLRRQLDYLTGKQVYIMLGAEGLATLGKIRSKDFQKAVGTYTPITLEIVCDGSSEGYFWEAESDALTRMGSPSVLSDPLASGGQVMVFDTYDQSVRFPLTQSGYALPEGNYKMFCRAKDTNQVSSDLWLHAYNANDSTFAGSKYHTITSGYALYTADVIIDSEDTGDSIEFVVNKPMSTTNTIYVDFFGFVRTD